MSTSALNDDQVRQEMMKMVNFIKQEAKDKANEILARGNEEYSIEKANLVQQEKVKINAQHERRLKQVEVQKRIAFSNRLNQARLKVLQSRDQTVDTLFGEAKQRLAQLTQNKDKYKQLLENLLLQGLYQLMESQVTVYCRRADVQLVQSVLPSAAARYEKEMKTKITLSVDQQYFLSDDIAGGVELSAVEGRIRCVNTLDSRLAQLQTVMLPDIRNILFGANENRAFFN